MTHKAVPVEARLTLQGALELGLQGAPNQGKRARPLNPLIKHTLGAGQP